MKSRRLTIIPISLLMKGRATVYYALFRVKTQTLIWSLIASSVLNAQPYAPVNKNASVEARKVLAYLYSIRGKYILSGQHNYNHEPNRYSDSVFAITGKYPAIWGTDFIWNGTNDNGEAIV